MDLSVAFYGGSFNPPHVAHVLAAAYLVSMQTFDRILVVPVFAHAFDKPLVEHAHRMKMCELAMGWLPTVEISPVEAELEVPNRTLQTLRFLKQRHPHWRLRLVMGSDQLAEADKWHGFDEVCTLAPPYVLGRIGSERTDVPQAILPDVSSTRVRECVASGGFDAEPDRWLAAMVPADVVRYIREHGLYRSAPGSTGD